MKYTLMMAETVIDGLLDYKVYAVTGKPYVLVRIFFRDECFQKFCTLDKMMNVLKERLDAILDYVADKAS